MLRQSETDIITPSINRKKVVCPIFYECGGCDFLHMTYDYQLQLKQAYIQDLFDQKGFDVKVNVVIKNDRP